MARATALDPGRSFIVQAPAGSGKTGLLVHRMLTLLTRVERPEQVLTITFTRKATSELRQRILGLLSQAEAGAVAAERFEQQGIDLAGKVLARSKAQDWHLLDSPEQLQILTIDAFCAKLTGDMPWLSRLGDKPRTTDQAEPHYAAAIEQLLSQLLAAPSDLSSALQTVLLELDFDYNKVRRMFGAMLAKRDQWLRHLLQNSIAGLRPDLESAWQEIRAEHCLLLEQLLAADTRQRLLEMAGQAAGFIVDKDSPLQVLKDCTPPQALDLPCWRALQFILLTKGGKGFRKTVDVRCGFPANQKALKQEMLAVLAQLSTDQQLFTALQQLSVLPEPHYSDADWQQITALEEVLKALAAFLQLRFRAVGECDHGEVARRANFALQELDSPTDLALRMDYQLQHILVDEFQDTSFSQLELLKKLTAGWQHAGTGNGQTLFLVGDPMQSIYRFREADVSLFLQVTDNSRTGVFSNIEIEPLQLTENFRSSSKLVDWFNRVFSSSFPLQDQVLTGAISYADATSNRPGPGQVYYQLAGSKQQEAEQVVAAIQTSLSSLPDDNARVAVLVRSRTHLKHLLPVLDAAGIAYSGVQIQPLRQIPAVIDVVTLCKAICRLDDRVSWLALLRGPWCGLTLTEIKSLAGAQSIPVWTQLQKFRLHAQPAGLLSESALARLTRFTGVMQQALLQRQQVGLHSLTHWAWQALGGEYSLMGAQAEDLQVVFALIEALQRGGDLPSLTDLDTALDKLYAEPQHVTEARVIVSTIHKAKGLQYDTVILPALGSPSKSDEKDVLMWAEYTDRHGEAKLLLAPIRLQQQEGSHFDYLRALDTQRGRNEMIRLMYVACTRAERQIFLISHAQLDAKAEAVRPPPIGSLLSTIWDAAADHFEFIAIETDDLAALQPDTPPLSQTLWRLPDDFSVVYPPSVEWQVRPQLLGQVEPEPVDTQIEYQWATEVAAAVGVVMHNWLQYNSDHLFSVVVDDALIRQWRAELNTLRVPADRQKWAVERLVQAIKTMQSDDKAQFIFADRDLQDNEYALSALENGTVSTYRLDRTFVDEHDTRWVIDYKTTSTAAEDLDSFVDQQVTERHRPQLEKYGALMSQLDSRPIKLAVYFPMLGRLRSWDYRA